MMLLFFLQEISPYLIISSKKKIAQLILAKYKALTPRNGRFSVELLKEKLDFYDEFISTKSEPPMK